jgi:hypothetical protein
MAQDNLTTDQLAAKVLQDVKQMTPEEKAEVRKHLDQSLQDARARGSYRRITTSGWVA